ncbi:hypothetical protein ACFE04_026480 [Oxalis oulophora]
MRTLRHFLQLLTILSTLFLVHCTPPDDPIKCSSSECTITNAYGIFPDRSICKAGIVTYPRSESDIISIVSEATKARRKIKVSTKSSHGIPKLVCPDGEDGVVISTKYLDRVLSMDIEAMTITVETGMLLDKLISEASKVGLVLPHVPYWWGLSVGGMVGVGAHGSSLWGKGPSIQEYVIEMRIVSPGENGSARVWVLNDQTTNNLFNAAKVSLGVLGVISQVTLQLEPMFKRSITYVPKSDSNLGDEVLNFGHQYEFADISWYPSQRKATYRVDHRVPSNTPGNGLYDATGFRSQVSLSLAAIRTAEESQEFTHDAIGKCVTGKLISTTLEVESFGLTNNDFIFTGYPVIGYQNRLQSSGSCLYSHNDALFTACAWDPRVKGNFYFQTTFSIALPMVKEFIQDIQKLAELEPHAFCGIDMYNGILMRYVKASSAYLGKQQDAIDFDITYYRSKDPLTPRLFEDILEEVEQIAIFKYNALPHWGKNRNVAFNGVIEKYKNAASFLKVKEMFDPLGLFSSQWTDQILGLSNGTYIEREGCGLEGLCICSKDSHCAPRKGYFCRPGKIFQDARVCTRIQN